VTAEHSARGWIDDSAGRGVGRTGLALLASSIMNKLIELYRTWRAVTN
jgi:hypothetical protein